MFLLINQISLLTMYVKCDQTKYGKLHLTLICHALLSHEGKLSLSSAMTLI